MTAKFDRGQKVKITPVKNQHASPRDSDIRAHAGQTGVVADYYWISTNRGEVFYIYTVQLETGQEEIVLHEDELEPCPA